MAGLPLNLSIAIISLNEESNLRRCLHSAAALASEIVVVDSGSSDGTLDIAQRWSASLVHVRSEEFTYGRALNVGMRAARDEDFGIQLVGRILRVHRKLQGRARTKSLPEILRYGYVFLADAEAQTGLDLAKIEQGEGAKQGDLG